MCTALGMKQMFQLVLSEEITLPGIHHSAGAKTNQQEQQAIAHGHSIGDLLTVGAKKAETYRASS